MNHGQCRISSRAGACVAAAVAAAALVMAAAFQSALAAKTTPPVRNIVSKARTTVSFTVSAPNPTTTGTAYAIARVLKDGKPVPAPANMTLDAKTGAFTWKPTESQPGVYDVTFAVKDAGGGAAAVYRRITVKARGIGGYGPASALLRKWYRKGTAAGNTGDFYDNRDSGHSYLRTAVLPQMDKIQYTKAQHARKRHWGAQLFFLYDHVTIGNSSTSGSVRTWGSNSRRCYYLARAVDVLYRQYTHNHLYVYPEHRDHDPGHNGRGPVHGGYGDLFPANTPYLITSQGSSGSDGAFLEAVGHTLAAFHPEVKKLLIDRGLVMPTVQMIFRMCNKPVEEAADYLTGKAHPSAFDRGQLDVVKMVKMAHAMRTDNVPPMIQLRVVEEDQPVPGRDHFEAGRGEKLFDTPAAIARVVRSAKYVRRTVVSAETSYDPNKRPLTFHWAVLRGDADRIKIRRLNKAGSVVELLVPYHERRPVRPGSPLESNRVDIGAFVHNGTYYSAPGFISFCYLDDEARTYDADGRIVEVGYGYGEATIGYEKSHVWLRDRQYDVTDWIALVGLLVGEKGGFGASLLRGRFTANQRAELAEAVKQMQSAWAAQQKAESAYKEAMAARTKARAATKAARKDLAAAEKDHKHNPAGTTQPALEEARTRVNALRAEQKKAERNAQSARTEMSKARGAASATLTRKRDALGGSVKHRLENALNAVAGDANFYVDNADAIHALCDAAKDRRAKTNVLAVRDGLVKWGILKTEGDDRFRLHPAIAGPAPAAERLTKYQRSRIRWFNVAILSRIVYPGLLKRPFQRNFVPPQLATPKDWRDVYHYDEGSRLIGWTRYDETGAKDLTADGALVVKRDRLGRAIEARKVKYVAEGRKGRNRRLTHQPTSEVLHYVYDSDADRVGHVRK